MEYRFALNGWGDRKKYLEYIYNFLNGIIKTERRAEEFGWIMGNVYLQVWHDDETEKMWIDTFRTDFDFEADFVVDFQVYSKTGEEIGTPILFKLVKELSSMGLKILFLEIDNEVLRKVGDDFEIPEMRKEYPYFLDEKDIRRFLK